VPEQLRPITPIKLKAITPGPVGEDLPKFEMVDPSSLLIEPSYQRQTSNKSLRLIGRIVANWDWTRMKPPICARNEKGQLVVMDGQHTAIAAASHPGIKQIPVMVVNAPTTNRRAMSFISHNTARVKVTELHLHHAAVEAGEELAVAIHDACTKAKVKLLRHPPPHNEFGEGEVIAIAALRMIVKDKGANGGARVLRILNDAGRMPIGASEMKAVYYFIYHFSKKSGQTITDEELSAIIVTKDQK
jgi:hypothetical protein